MFPLCYTLRLREEGTNILMLHLSPGGAVSLCTKLIGILIVIFGEYFISFASRE